MRYDKILGRFIGHPDWYSFVRGVGYVPTELAPPDAIHAMEEYNSYGIPHPADLAAFLEQNSGIDNATYSAFLESVRAEVEARKVRHTKDLD